MSAKISNQIIVDGRVSIGQSIEPIAPVADFTANVTSGTFPLNVTFTDTSTESPTTWAWDFQNNGSTDSVQQNPSFTYTSAGTYSVKLTATNAVGSGFIVKTGYITVSTPAPVANFVADVTSGVLPLEVQFADTSTNTPTSWAWDFQNNGSTDSTVQNPTFTYSSAGTYSVKLTATNAGGSDTLVKTSYITVSAGVTGEALFTTPGTYSWTAPTGVTSVSVVAVGGGGAGSAGVTQPQGGGAGGGLAWTNNITVVPGNSYTVVVGAGGGEHQQGSQPGDGGTTYFIDTSTVAAGGGLSKNSGGTGGIKIAGTGGGSGGATGTGNATTPGGAGGAAGYSGNGGQGGAANATNNAGSSGSGGSGGGGGGGPGRAVYGGTSTNAWGAGGGVGLYGQGSNGSGGATRSTGGASPYFGLVQGGGGSGGQGSAETSGITGNTGSAAPGGLGGNYGGGGGGRGFNSPVSYGYAGGGGAVRIMWGAGRSFPSNAT